MPKIVPIVEGDGEVLAVPLLLNKLIAEIGRWEVGIDRPLNAGSCSNLTKAGGLERFVQNAALRADCGAILVLMDADKGCPLKIVREFVERITTLGTKYPVVVAVANCEYEAWFLASLESIAGKDLEGRRGLPAGLTYPDYDVENLVDVKGWLRRHLSRKYKETLDQPALTRMINPALIAPRSRSFRRLQHAVEEAVEAMDLGHVVVTPAVIDEELEG